MCICKKDIDSLEVECKGLFGDGKVKKRDKGKTISHYKTQ